MQHHKSKKDKRKKLEQKKSGDVDVSDPGKIEAPKVSKNPTGPVEPEKMGTDDMVNDADIASDDSAQR